MIRPRFKFYFKPDDTNWYTTVNDIAVTTPTKTALQFDPVDWENTEITYVRHETYKGVMRAYTAPITFCEDGALILRTVFYTQGYNGRVIFEMEMTGENSQAYTNAFSGEVDFSSQSSDQQNTFQTAVLDRGLIAKIKARQNLPYSIELSEESAPVVKIKMDGVKLTNRSYFTALLTQIGTGVDANQVGPPMSHSQSEAPYTQDIRNTNVDTGLVQDIAGNSWFYKASYANTVKATFSGSIRAVWTGVGAIPLNAQFRVWISRKNASSGTLNSFTFFLGPILGSGSTNIFYTIPPTTVDIPVAVGDTLALIYAVEPVNQSGQINRWQFETTDAKCDIAYSLRQPTTIVRAFRQIDLWKLLIARIAEDFNWDVQSDYLTNPDLRRWGHNPYNTFITSGDAVRGIGDGFDGTSAFIKVKMTDLFADLSNRDAVGLTVENNAVRIELLPYFYNQNLVSLKLGLVDNFSIAIDTKSLYNVLSIGYQYESNDLLNGKQDPHTTFVYGVPSRYVDQAADWTSPFTASMYAWEFMRKAMDKKSTTDSSRDNDLFIIEVDPVPNGDGTYNPYRPQNEAGNYVKNLEANDTAINLTLMPEYNLRRKSSLVHANMYLMTKALMFQRADQNMSVVSKLSSALPEVTANAFIKPEDMDASLHLPLLLKFNYPTLENFDSTLMTGKNALIEFDFLDKFVNQIRTTQGFLEKVIVVNGENSASEWMLRAGPNIDLSNLIR